MRRRARRTTGYFLAAMVAFALPLPRQARSESSSALRFVRAGGQRSIERTELAKLCGIRRISIEDPYYGGMRSYLACPLIDVLRAGFGPAVADLSRLDVIFRASDGYAKASSGTMVSEQGGWLAFSDADRGTLEKPGWSPIDRRQVDPGPYYVVWEHESQRDGNRYPWPYQLVQIELNDMSTLYPLTVPPGAAAGSPELAGYAIFKSDCIACHSINGQGGKVGPDLNVPRSIVEYRPEEQIRQYIRNPASFRYTSMPAHEYLSDAQLGTLLSYFHAMSRDKHDPGKKMP